MRDIGHGDGASVEATIIAAVAAFISGYPAIAWLLRYLATHSLGAFIAYRIPLWVLFLAATGTIS